MGNINESRIIQGGMLSVRGSRTNDSKISGLAIPYNTYTKVITRDGFFFERIARGALKQTISDGHVIGCLVGHDEDSFLGDTRKNLVLHDREDGLYFELTLENERAMKMAEGVRRGFFDKCSFEFRKVDFKDEILGGMKWRTIHQLELFEISLVDRPAYRQTSAIVDNGLDVGYRGLGISVAATARDGVIQYAAHRNSMYQC